MVKSIRWRIQLWHSAVLLLVVECFGTLFYWRLEQSQFAAIDTELEGAAQLVVSVLRSLPPPELERPGPLVFPDRSSVARPLPRPPRPSGRLGPPRDGPESLPPDRHREQMSRFDASLKLPESLRVRYAERREGRPFLVIWKSNGDVLKADPPRAPIARPEAALFGAEGAVAWRWRGEVREALAAGPSGSRVVVGRSAAAELADLRQWMWLLVGAGAGLVTVGIVGGVVLSYGSLESIRAMSAMAAGISDRNLTERIDAKQIDSELRELADTLNGMFARLEDAFARHAQFTADASHELRTPLTVMLGNLELALSQPDLTPAVRESLEASLRAARRMRALVDHLLTLARADAGVLEVERQLFDLSGTVEECVELLKPLAREKQVELHVEARPAEIVGDPRLVAQVVINLVTNGIQYNRPGGRVDVSVAARSRDVVLVVADTGSGIPAESQTHLFERFYRVDKARSRASGGTGLGLAITKGIVGAHRGQIEVESEVGEGTTIRVSLPRDESSSQAC